MSESALPRPPETLEGFRIGPLRRSAGALAVHAAVDRLDLAVEVHVVRTDALRGPFTADQFVGILRRAAEVRHESLLPYVTGGRAGDLVFAAAKTVDAAALDEVIARGGALAEERVIAIGAAIAGVLAALERAGLRHGDLTPRRILLPGRGQVAVSPPRLVPRDIAPGHERYASPEESRGEAGDVRSDLFVLGLLLVEAATASPLFKGSTSDARRALAAGQVPPLPAATPPALRGVLARLLAVDPSARFPTASAAEIAILGAAAAGVAADVAPVATAVPLDELPPETAPIPKGLAAAVAARAAGAAAPVPQAAGAAPSPPAQTSSAQTPSAQAADGSSVRRTPGRLYVQGRLGESMLEIDETVHVGWPAGAIDVAARPEPFPEAEFVVERTEMADLLRAVGSVRVNGKPATSAPLQHGDRIEGAKVRARYERNVRAAFKATGAASGTPPNPRPARMLLAGSLVVAIVGVLVSLPRFTGARRAADEAETAAALAEKDARAAQAAVAPVAPAGDPAVSAREQAARDAYDKARDFQRRNPGDLAGCREQLAGVVERFGDTGHGAIARAELAEVDRRARSAGAGEVEKLLASVKKDADEGRLDSGLNALRTYAEMHPGTVAAERAFAAAVQLESEVRGRFEADVARVERALAQKDWAGAIRLLDAIMEYVPNSLRDRAHELRMRAEAGRDGVDLPPKGPGGAADGPKPPEAPKPPTGPEPPPGPGQPPAPPTGPAAGGDRDKAADQAFRDAKKLMESGKDEEAIDAFLAFLRDWKDTRPGARYDVEARGRIMSLTQGAAGVTKLFHGKCEKIEKGRWRISYDFADARQFEDFRNVEAFDAPPRADWKLVDGAARSKGSGAFVLDATFTTDLLVTSVTVSPERPHDLGVLYLDASEPRRYYLFTLQNSWFKLGKGEGAKVFEENAIVLFGPGMWRDTPPGELGFVRKCGTPEPTIRPGESTPIKCGKAEGQVWLRLEGGKQVNGSAYGDIKLEFQGIEPGVFVMNSSGTFDDFVVEGTPDPEWVARRWRAILSGL